MADGDDDGWKFELEDLPGADDEAGDGEAGVDEAEADADDDSGGNVAGSIGVDQELQPGSPSLENTAFVLLGALCTVLFFLVLVGVF